MKIIRNTVIALVFGYPFISTGALSAQQDWQRAMLHSPSAAQLKMERRGRVFIYDGLDEAEVDRAMDSQFGRVDNMMFVRTQKKTESGEAPADEDC
jgi:hypothetical protein